MFRGIKGYALFIAVLSFLISTPALAGKAVLTWDPSATSPELIGGYKIHYGIQSGVYDEHIDVGNVTTATLDNLPDGVTLYFAASAYSPDGMIESGYSNEVSKDMVNKYSITVTTNSGGTVTATGYSLNQASSGAQIIYSVSVVQGATIVFTIKPNNRFVISSIVLDGVKVANSTILTLSSVQAAHGISITFSKKTGKVAAATCLACEQMKLAEAPLGSSTKLVQEARLILNQMPGLDKIDF